MAITNSLCNPISVIYVYIPNGRVRVSTELVMSKGHTKEFQEPTTFIIQMKIKVGRTIGSAILNKYLKSVDLSRQAAMYIEVGIDLNALYKM